MIGNDIVDLDLAARESNWQRKGFLDKIFTESEQKMIFNHNIPEVMVWILWSKKESAYKIYNRITLHRAYIPLNFQCADMEVKGDTVYGKIVCDDMLFFTKTFVSKESIRTVAVKDEKDLRRIKVLDRKVMIRKTNDIPDFLDKTAEEFRPISISHHGRFESLVAIS
ncbi:MAG: 4-phosphopantetheinyl transferase family protein [Flavobacterium sp.]|nr:MAG: 4-phosphopantetheinyl transferase family protein [Flavobacterium sp.]